MDLRSEYLLGKEVFIKIIRISSEADIIQFIQALKTGDYIPFTCNEVAINYLINIYQKNLISPDTRIFSSNKQIFLNDLRYLENLSLKEIIDNLNHQYKEFSPNSLDTSVKTFLIVSRRVTGNLDAFIDTYIVNSSEKEKELEDALIHISYLYFQLQKTFKALHVDPKLANHTWLKLKNPTDITYDFSDEFHGTQIIKRQKVKHLFFLTDLEFVFSPVIKSQKLNKEMFYYNFSYKYEWLNDSRRNLIYVPKISTDPYYDYNVNLYAGYNAPVKYGETNKEIFGLFPRMFSIDLLTLIKMILSHHYVENLSANILRKLNIYFTLFQSLSRDEEENKYKVDYRRVSPYALAELINA